MNRAFLLAFAGFVLAALVVCPAYAVTYHTMDLGAWMQVTDMNQSGQVVGTGLDYNARIWDPRTGVSVLPCQPSAYPKGVNDSGVVVASTGQGQAIRIDATGSTTLIGLSSLKNTPSEINNADQVAGASYGAGGLRPVLWSADGSVSDLGVLDPHCDTGWANDVNDAGQVVGKSGTHAFLWSRASGMRDLGPGEAMAISNSGLVVVNSADHLSSYIWRDGTGLAPLGKLSDWASNLGADINGLGQVVGGATDAEGRRLPVLWNPDGSIVVLPKPSDAAPSYGCAIAINDAGWVLGSVYQEALLWTPVPEPSSLAALLAGLAGFGALVRRRR